MTSSGSQSLVLGSKGFTRGVHYWEVKVDSQAQHGNIFIGELACSLGLCEVPGPSPVCWGVHYVSVLLHVLCPGVSERHQNLSSWMDYGFISYSTLCVDACCAGGACLLRSLHKILPLACAVLTLVAVD